MSQLPSGESTDVAAPARINREAVEALAGRPAESPLVARRRREAWEAYERIPLPGPRDEEWRRTDIRPLKLDEVVTIAEPVAPVRSLEELPESARAALAGDTGRSGLLVQLNASAAYRKLDQALAEKGAIFTDLESAARDYPDLFERLFMTEAVRASDDKFTALNGAFWTGGSFLYVPRNTAVELPIQSLVWGDGKAALFPHTLIVAETGSEVTYIDQYASAEGALGPDQGFASGIVEIIARPGAKVDYINLQEWGTNVWSFGSLRAVVDQDATVNTLMVAFGGKLSRARVQTALQGIGSSARMLGILFGDDHQVFDHHTLQDHLAPRTTSDLLYKTALKDHSRSVFSGLIRAHRAAQKTDAVQTNRNLLLSNKARADAIPNLEIEANDLRCTHAAAVSPVDEEQLFYLMCRGLNQSEATRLIVEGFFASLFDQIPLPGIRERVRQAVERKVTEGSDIVGPGADNAGARAEAARRSTRARVEDQRTSLTATEVREER